MTTLEAIQAWHAAQYAERDVVVGDGLLLEVRESSAVSRYAWTAGELTGIVEPDGSRWNYEYGDDGRLLSVLRNGSVWARYTYDAGGRLIEVCRVDGSLTYSYDGRGRLVRTLRGDASPFVYRWEGERVASARCDREESRFHYDLQGRVTGLDQRLDGIELPVRFVFDDAGRLGAIDFPAWRHNIQFDWDERGRPATIAWDGRVLSRFGTDDTERLFWAESLYGVREETWHDVAGGRPRRKAITRDGQKIWRRDLVRDEAFRIVKEGTRAYEYDALGRLREARDGDRVWRFRQDAMDQPILDSVPPPHLEHDAAGRLRFVRQGWSERVLRYNDAGELTELLVDGTRVARCGYDHKGRLVVKAGSGGVERYLYGVDDSLLAIADGEGRPLTVFLRLPVGIVGMVDFREDAAGSVTCLHSDTQGNLVFASTPEGGLDGPFDSDPYGVPLQAPRHVPYFYRGRPWHPELALYPLGCRWYDPALRQFLTPDTYTGAPDDERLVNPFGAGREQRAARLQILGDWLREPRWRNRYAYCNSDPVNRFDPNGHWSFGGVLLSLLGVLWTLPNTVFGLAVEVSCLIGEIVRWIVWLCSAGHVTWQTPGFDVAASSRLNAFALVFKGGWLGSFQNLLGITFGNVIFVNGEYQNHPDFQKLSDPVAPKAYNGTVTIPKSQALYEHELRHVNQYGWFGPFFLLGLPIWGVYEWDCILNGYDNAHFEADARDHGGF